MSILARVKTATLALSPVQYCQLNESSGTTVNDVSGNGLNGTYAASGITLNQAGPAADGSVPSVALNGASNISLGSSTSLNPPAVGWGIWVNLGSASLSNTYTSILLRRGPVLSQSLLVKSTGKLAVYIVPSSGVSVNYDGSGTHTLAAGIWYLLSFSYSSAIGLIGFVNGVQDGTAAANGTIGTITATSFVGIDPGFSGRLLTGNVCQEVFYNFAPTAAQWLGLYQAMTNPFSGGDLLIRRRREWAA